MQPHAQLFLKVVHDPTHENKVVPQHTWLAAAYIHAMQISTAVIKRVQVPHVLVTTTIPTYTH
jgi:hypothetical protein